MTMTDHIDQTLSQALEKLKAQERDVAQTKRFVNQLLAFAEREPMFLDIDSESVALTLRGDEYYGQKQQTAARLVLERRKAMNLGPATPDEIFSAMKQGGYRHNAIDDAMATKSLYNTLTQNTATFHKLPTGKFGLAQWYPNVPKKVRAKTAAEDVDAEGPDESEADEGGATAEGGGA
jgi:hypothetical protein